MPKRGLPRSFHHDNTISQNSNNTNLTDVEEGVLEPDVNDVISGRGDTINRHPGNVQFRKLVEEKRRVYLTSHFKREKRLIAKTIVATIKAMDPPGRFLSREPRTGLWFSIGEDRAREKASQALRENSKKIRAEIQQDNLLRKHENAALHYQRSRPHSHSLDGYYSAVKPGHYDPHHFHFAPSGPGWGYPYYYGYGPSQVPPYPPPAVFHPHANPQPSPPVPPGGHLPVHSGSAFPDGVPFGSSRRDFFDQDPSRLVLKSNQASHPQYSENSHVDQHMDSSDCSNNPGTRADIHPRKVEEESPTHQEHQQRRSHLHSDAKKRSSMKYRRIEPTNEQAGEQTQPKALLAQPRHHRFSVAGHLPIMPPPNSSNSNGNNSTHFNEQTPQKLLSLSPDPLKSPKDRPFPGQAVLPHSNLNALSHDNTIPTTHNHASTPVHKITSLRASPSCYTIKSPHIFGGHKYPRGGSSSFEGGSPNAALTPAGATCLAALDEILASPHHGSIEYPAAMATCHTALDSPLPAASQGKDPSVPFSPIRAHVVDTTTSSK